MFQSEETQLLNKPVYSIPGTLRKITARNLLCLPKILTQPHTTELL